MLDDLNMIALGALGVCMLGLLVCLINLLIKKNEKLRNLVIKIVCMIFNSVH